LENKLKLHVTVEDFEKVEWQDELRRIQPKNGLGDQWCDYHRAFKDLAAASAARGEEREAKVFWLLFFAFHLPFDPEHDNRPFPPVEWTQNDTAFTLPRGFTAVHLDVFKAILTQSEVPEFQSRLGDILWTHRRDHQSARIAVQAYLQLHRAELEFKRLHVQFSPLKRAVQIAAQLSQRRWDDPLYVQVWNEVDRSVLRISSSSRSDLTKRLLKIALEQRWKPFQHYRDVALCLAESWRTPEGANSIFVIEFLRLAHCFARRDKDAESVKSISVKIAETHVERADFIEASSNQHAMVEADALADAIIEYRKIGGEKYNERIEQLEIRRKEAQRKARQQCKPFKIGFDVTGLVNMIKQSVENKDFDSGLRNLASLAPYPAKTAWAGETKQMSDGLLVSQLSTIIKTDSQDNVCKTTKGQNLDDENQRKEAILSEARSQAALNQKLVGIAVDPARKILASTAPASDCFGLLISDNTFIPPGRQEIYERGLKAGLDGDWLVCAHLLVPQLENSIRHVLACGDATMSKQRQDGTQDEIIKLKQMLENEEAVKFFGEDLVFDLEVLLVDPGDGNNLRNDVCHGFLDPKAFSSGAVHYLWWLTLHILFGFKQPAEAQSSS